MDPHPPCQNQNQTDQPTQAYYGGEVDRPVSMGVEVYRYARYRYRLLLLRRLEGGREKLVFPLEGSFHAHAVEGESESGGRE